MCRATGTSQVGACPSLMSSISGVPDVNQLCQNASGVARPEVAFLSQRLDSWARIRSRHVDGPLVTAASLRSERLRRELTPMRRALVFSRDEFLLVSSLLASRFSMLHEGARLRGTRPAGAFSIVSSPIPDSREGPSPDSHKVGTRDTMNRVIAGHGIRRDRRERARAITIRSTRRIT